MKSILVKGSGAEEFLQRVTAGTVKGLRAGQGTAGLLHNGQSKMIAQFDLLKRAEGEYLLAAPSECAVDLAAGLEKLHFSEDLEIVEAEGVLCARGVSAGAGAGASSGAGAASGAASGQREKFFSVEGGAWPSPVPGYEFTLGASPDFPAGWDFARIGALYPWPRLDWDSATPALEAGVLPAIDRFKGCYPGQEVVELSLNVGHPVRVLLGMVGGIAQVAGGKVPLEGGGEGLVTSVGEVGGVYRIFVRVPWAKREQVVAGFTLLRG